MIKTFLKTTVAVATLIAGSQSWGATISLAELKSDGTMGPSHGMVVGTSGIRADAVTATNLYAMVAAPDKSAIRFGATPTILAGGGLVCTGSSVTLDVAAAWTIVDLIAVKNMDVYLRSDAKATNRTVTITNAILSAEAKVVNFWVSDVTLTLTNVKTDARVNRDSETVGSLPDVPLSTTKILGGRTYTLSKIASIAF